jgi:hypothetical protein
MRSGLSSHLTPYSIARILNIIKLGDAVGAEEKLRLLNPKRLLFTDHKLIEVTQRIAKDHAIILWGNVLQLTMKVLRNPNLPQLRTSDSGHEFPTSLSGRT